MTKKNYFSRQSKAYAAFRPMYPADLYEFIFQHLKDRSRAWDCATGNGQVALHLAKHFGRVFATDISRQQLDNAFPAENIVYAVSPAEHTSFESNQFDLITVAQALHWFDVSSFYNEVRRTCKAGGLLAVWGYAMVTVEAAIDELFLDFYHNTVGPHWDAARKHVENRYRDMAFPFHQIACPDFYIREVWTADQFTGYLSSWSATQKFMEVRHYDPVSDFANTLRKWWKKGEKKTVTFPVFMKLGRVHP